MIDEHFGFVFHYELHSYDGKGARPPPQRFSAPQIDSNKLKR